ncbi:MAG: hypothetical protein ACRDF6_06975, partial [bacterium]
PSVAPKLSTSAARMVSRSTKSDLTRCSLTLRGSSEEHGGSLYSVAALEILSRQEGFAIRPTDPTSCQRLRPTVNRSL